MLNKDINLKNLNKAYLQAQKSLIALAEVIENTFPPGTFVTSRVSNESLTVTDVVPTDKNSIPDILKLEVMTASGNRIPITFTDLLEWEIFAKKVQ